MMSRKSVVIQKALAGNPDLIDQPAPGVKVKGAKKINCAAFTLARAVLDSLDFSSKMLQEAFCAAGDSCFCSDCHEARGDSAMCSRGTPPRPYILPVGWCRFGLRANAALVAANDPFNTWNGAFHGTSVPNMHRVFNAGLTLLKAGDIVLGEGGKPGEVLGVGNGHIKAPFQRLNKFTGKQEQFDPNQIFSSPSIAYSSLPQYATTHTIDHPSVPGEKVDVQVVFQLRQRPGSFAIGQETVLATQAIDPHIANSELEYYTKENVGILLQGLLLKVTTQAQQLQPPRLYASVKASAAPVDTLADQVARASPQDQKNILGERLYYLILAHQPELAGRITGMLLEMDNAELLYLIESPEALAHKIDEALVVLKNQQGAEEYEE
jgi:hypothetical protein